MIKTYYLSQQGRNYKLSKNFTLSEFASRDGADKVLVDEKLVEILQKVRDKFGITELSSGYRTEEHNKKVGGSSKSYHVKGMAADFYCRNANQKDVILFLEDIGVYGIGIIDNNFVHIDTREKTSKWYGNEVTGETITSFYDYYDIIPFFRIGDIIPCGKSNYKVTSSDRNNGKLTVVLYKGETEPKYDLPMQVQVKALNVPIRTNAGENYPTTRFCPLGVYTITDVVNGFGKLKSNAGWINLEQVTIISK